MLSWLLFFRGANSSVAVQPGTTIQSSQQISAESLNLHAGTYFQFQTMKKSTFLAHLTSVGQFESENYSLQIAFLSDKY